MSRQRKRHLARMPLDETVRLGVCSLMAGELSVYVEVHDHDDIQGVVVVVELDVSADEENVRDLCKKVRLYLNVLVDSNPDDCRLASWCAIFKKKGQKIASFSIHDAPPSIEMP